MNVSDIEANPPGRWRALAVISAAQIGAMSTWFSAAAAAPSLARDWHLTPPQVGLLTVAVQLGFVVGALASAVSGIADIFSARAVFAGSAVAAAAANGLLAAASGDLRVAIPSRFLLGVVLAGVYPTGMKLMTGWFREGRGLAIGVLVGALTLGSALPHAVAGIGVTGQLSWQPVIVVTSLGALASAAMVGWLVHAGPLEAPSARLDLGWALRSFRNPAIRLANLGYFGHMWELYAMWTWIPAFFLASFQTLGGTVGPTTTASCAAPPGAFYAAAASASCPAIARSASIAAAWVIGIGAIGCVAGGLVADRVGRTATTAASMALSGGSAVATGLLFGAPAMLVVGIATIWGVSVIADSAQFSASISELAEPDRVGSALALQTALGFLLTAVSIQALPFVLGGAGWRGAFAMLAVGPALGVVVMLRLRHRPEAVRLAGGRR